MKDINSMSQFKITEDKSIMDCAKNLEKTFDIKQKAMVNKLHNMQWLKNTSHSSNPEKVKIIYKHIQDHDENNKLEDKGLLTENIKIYSIEESDKYQMDTYKRYLPNDAMPGSDENVWNKDVNLPNLFSNSKKLINQKNEEEEDILMIPERRHVNDYGIVTAKLDTHFYTDKMQEDRSNMSQNNAEDITQNAVCSHLSNLQVGQDTQKLNLIKHSGNNNHSKSTQSCMLRINKQKPTIGKVIDKNTKASMKAKNKDAQIKKTINASKKNVNDGDNISNDNQQSSTPISNSKRSISNLSNTPSSVNKDIKVDRFNNKNISTRNKIEKEIKNANSSLVKTNLIKQNLIKQTKFNKTVDVTCQSNNINKDRILQKQHIVSKSISRMQESLKKNASMLNYAVYKTDTLACNNENENLINAKTYLTEDKFANINIDNIEPMLGQCHEEVEKIDESKADIDQQCIEINNATDNEYTNLYKHSSNLLSNKYTVETSANAIHQHSIKLDYIQHMNDVKKLRSNRTTWNNRLSNNTMQKNATIVNSQQSIQNMRFNVQQTSTQAKDETKQMPPSEPNSSKCYNQPFSVSNAMRLSQIPNTFNMASYESNIQTSNESDVTSMLEATMNHNKENSNVLYKYTPNTQQRFDTFSDSTGHPTLSDQTNRRNPLVQDGFHVGPYNAMRPTIMHISNSNAFGSDDSNNTHIMNCLLHPIIYAPSPNVQTWNQSQLQYPLPVFNNSPYASSTSAMSNTTNQSNNYNSIGSMHDQQLKYISCMQMNNYIRGTHSDLSNCTVQARNIVDNVPVKSNQHYKKCQDNSRMIYNPSQYVPSLSHSESQQDMNFMPIKCINQCNNAYFCQIQKHHEVNYMQMSKDSKSQMIEDLACDDNESENIAPIISPKEFITANES